MLHLRFSLLPLPSTLRCHKSEVNLWQWWIWQSNHSSVEAGHAGPDLDSCDQWLSAITLTPWPLFHPEECLPACTTHSIFYVMLPNPLFNTVFDIRVLVFPKICSLLPNSLPLYPSREWAERCCWLLPSHLPSTLLLATPPAAWS